MAEAAGAAGDEQGLILKMLFAMMASLYLTAHRAQFAFIILFILAQNRVLKRPQGWKMLLFVV